MNAKVSIFAKVIIVKASGALYTDPLSFSTVGSICDGQADRGAG